MLASFFSSTLLLLLAVNEPQKREVPMSNLKKRFFRVEKDECEEVGDGVTFENRIRRMTINCEQLNRKLRINV